MAVGEKETLHAAVQGDGDALSQLLVSHAPELHVYVEGLVGSRHRNEIEASDVMQVTFTEAFIGISKFRPEAGRFGAWLGRIAANNVRDAIRGLRREKRPPPSRRVVGCVSEDSYESFLGTLAGSGTTPTRRVSREDLKRVVDEAIEKLPFDYQSVIRQYELGGVSGPEVAARMGKSVAAIYMLRARALDHLRTLLVGSWISMGYEESAALG